MTHIKNANGPIITIVKLTNVGYKDPAIGFAKSDK